ncbi:hypothetical protein PanWU01x14_014170 [Parasponia andersonii]|uniref:Uncharacterized protein n=1 Tax=Parasponia andersonii TaxID=3476 RepID=A0A2P5E095_PARAD|nr:hypothetical protein PanWU01x14_014170 [Parasponia andersonii]
MVIQRLEMCIEMVKMAIEFVIVVAEAVGVVIQQNSSSSPQPLRSTNSALQSSAYLPFIGFLP